MYVYNLHAQHDVVVHSIGRLHVMHYNSSDASMIMPMTLKI